MRISDWSSDVCSSDLSTVADVRMRIWNADGSEVEACGNATRCVAALVGRECSIETAGGLLSAAPGGDGASVDMGAPRFGWEEIPLAYALDTTALPVGWEMLEGAAAINVGNPHLVFFVRSEEHTSELQSLMRISYAVFCLKK